MMVQSYARLSCEPDARWHRAPWRRALAPVVRSSPFDDAVPTRLPTQTRLGSILRVVPETGWNQLYSVGRGPPLPHIIPTANGRGVPAAASVHFCIHNP